MMITLIKSREEEAYDNALAKMSVVERLFAPDFVPVVSKQGTDMTVANAGVRAKLYDGLW